MSERATAALLPPRFERPNILAFIAWVLAAALLISALRGTNFSPSELVTGLPNMARIVGEMFPPSLERIVPVAKALLETFQMALVGSLAGVILSVPLAVLAT